MEQLSVKIVKDDIYEYKGIVDFQGCNKLLFVNRRYPDEIILVSRAKFVNTSSKEVKHLNASSGIIAS